MTHIKRSLLARVWQGAAKLSPVCGGLTAQRGTNKEANSESRAAS
jgi:hypothetical protein